MYQDWFIEFCLFALFYCSVLFSGYILVYRNLWFCILFYRDDEEMKIEKKENKNRMLSFIRKRHLCRMFIKELFPCSESFWSVFLAFDLCRNYHCEELNFITISHGVSAVTCSMWMSSDLERSTIFPACIMVAFTLCVVL